MVAAPSAHTLAEAALSLAVSVAIVQAVSFSSRRAELGQWLRDAWDPPKPAREARVAVIECVAIDDEARSEAEAATAVRWVSCTGDYGDQFRETEDVNA
eukprot:CAMPEP_0206833280 /NCGR_PEP_ID=MMETSP0975-20121206/18314_1 /ASSEMBLY_ACC=CAM_ASM_000399 /TAXON_ID=483370 /ORGANISM="non described non described, Strain CCMP2097" /LENGTH=98 /DNA_ID=CAMNT_0054375673 /DNA_START=20 /DNA_END=313 /DNA_ORIENTATION=+